ncbi:MAG: thiolase family protein [Xanthobacteraceae bacterium]
MKRPRSYEGIAVAVPVSSERFRTTRRLVPWFVGRTLAELIRQSGLQKQDIDGLTIASYNLAPDNAASLAEYFGIAPRFILDLPYGGASGVMAMARAARAVQAGDAEVVACIAADIAPSGYGIYSNFSSFTRDHVYPYGAGGANAVFALITSNYMREFGATAEDFGRICVAQRANGAQHSQTLFKKPLTMDEYLSARMICDPLRLYDCVPRCCAAEGFLVMEEARARSLNLPHAKIGGVVERTNGFSNEPVMRHVGIFMDRDSLYDQANMGPDEIDFVQAYDDYPVIVMMQLEALGFCKHGESPKLVRERSLMADGDLPLNTSGGMLSLGQAGAAGGSLGMNETLRQLTGRSLGARVPDAEAGVVSCFGTVNYDRGVCSSAAILTAGGRA